MAEWLRRGLQILARRFDSGSGLHFSQQCESAALAQLVEHIIRNDGVRCSSHLSGTTFMISEILPCPWRPPFMTAENLGTIAAGVC